MSVDCVQVGRQMKLCAITLHLCDHDAGSTGTMEEREEIALDTINVSNNQFYSHYPRRISKGTVDAEQVKIQLDKEWDGLTVRIHWLNVTSKVEKKPLLERDKPNTIPWEVLADLGELHMGLVGLDGNTVIKPTIWLTYGYVVDGVDPEAGSDPQPPTPSWEQQMVEQATQANQAAQAAQEAAEDAADSAASAGPYAEESKKSAEVAKASREAAATSAQQASQAAKDAQAAAGSIGNAVEQAQSAATAADVAKRAAETAQTAAAQSAGTAQGAATTASQAAQTAQGAATQAGQYLASVEADAQAAASAATAAGKSQEAAQGAAQAAVSARDQANTAATAADTAKGAAEQAATTAGNAQAGAAQSAQAAASSASAAQTAKEAAEAAASILPAPTQDDAGKVPMVNPEGTRFVFVKPGEIWDRLDDITLNSDVLVYYIAKLSKYDKILLLNDGPYSAERGNLSWRIGLRNNLDQKVGTLFYTTVSMNNMHRDILFESELFDDGYIGSISARWNNNGQIAPVQASFSGKMLNKQIKNSNAESNDVTLEFESLTEVQINGLETINVFGRRR